MEVPAKGVIVRERSGACLTRPRQTTDRALLVADDRMPTGLAEGAIFCLAAASLLTPLLAFPETFHYPFVVPKVVFFRTVVLLLVGVYSWQLLFDPARHRPRATVVSCALLAYWVSLLTATLFSVDLHRSLWDTHERMLGLFTLTHYFLFFLVLSRGALRWEQWRALFRWFLLVGSVVVAVGLWQHLVDPEFLLNNGPRVVATLGNANYLSHFGLFLLGLGALLAVTETRVAWKLWGGAGSALGGLGILLGQSRAALGALAAGTLCVAILGSSRVRRGSATRLALWSLLGTLGLLAGLAIVFRGHEVVRALPGIGRFAELGLAHTLRGRIWGMSVVLWREHPLVGWGLNTFSVAFNRHHPAEALRYGWAETWHDSMHNFYLETLVTSGVLGLAAVAAVYGALLWSVWRAPRSSSPSEWWRVLLTGIFVAHLANIMFSFENVTSLLAVFLLFAFVDSLAEPPEAAEGKEPRDPPRRSRAWRRPLPVLALAAAGLAIHWGNVEVLRANRLLDRLVRRMAQGASPAELRGLVDEASRTRSPHLRDFRLQFAASTYQVLAMQRRSDRAAEVFALAYEEIGRYTHTKPVDVRPYLVRAQLAQTGYRLTRRTSLLGEATDALQEALRLSPRRQQLEYELANVLLLQGRTSEAARALRRAIEHDPMLRDSWKRLHQLYGMYGWRAQQEELERNAKKHGIDL
jgi:O-antigen ligase